MSDSDLLRQAIERAATGKTDVSAGDLNGVAIELSILYPQDELSIEDIRALLSRRLSEHRAAP